MSALTQLQRGYRLMYLGAFAALGIAVKQSDNESDREDAPKWLAELTTTHEEAIEAIGMMRDGRGGDRVYPALMWLRARRDGEVRPAPRSVMLITSIGGQVVGEHVVPLDDGVSPRDGATIFAMDLLRSEPELWGSEFHIYGDPKPLDMTIRASDMRRVGWALKWLAAAVDLADKVAQYPNGLAAQAIERQLRSHPIGDAR